MDLATLSKIYTAEGPFTTIYLATDSADENAAEMLRAAVGTGAEIRFVAGDVAQSPAEGIGALLRYRTATA